MSKYLSRFISSILLFGMIGGAAMHASAAEEVQPVKRQFSTLEEITSICVKENGSSVTIRPGKDDWTYVNYADTSEERLYDVYVNEGTLVVDKLKENPPEIITSGDKVLQFSSDGSYRLEIVLPQKQYESIVITNSSNGGAELDSISSANISIELGNGAAKFSQTQSDSINAEIENGLIAFDRTNSLKYDCKVENGSIQGSVIGDYKDYTVDAYIGNGTCNLKSHTVSDSGRSIKLHVENGQIKVEFNGR